MADIVIKVTYIRHKETFMDSQWNNWHFASFSNPTPDVLTWQISPFFVMLSLVLAMIPLCAIMPIREQIRKLNQQRQAIYLGGQIVVSCVLGCSIWAIHLLLMLGVQISTPPVNLTMIFSLFLSCANYFLFLRMSSKAEATKKEKYSWALLNTATICTIQATLIIPLTHQNHFSLSAFSLFISLILITLTGIMMLSIGDHEKDEKIIIINIKSALLCLYCNMLSH